MEPGIIPSTTAVSILSHDQLWIALVTMSLLCTLYTFLQAFATSHPTPLATLAQNWCTPLKNDLKWPQIKQVTNSKLHYIKANRLLSPVLQKIVCPT